MSDLLPKPLLPVLGVPVLERTLARLAGAGVESTAVNLHHLGSQIAARLGDEVSGMPLSYWRETELLGTLGPLGRLGAFFSGSDTVLLVNGDSLCRWPVGAVVRAHRAHRAEATLLLSSRADPESFGGGVVVDELGRVRSFRGEGTGVEDRRGVFAGLHAIAPGILANVAAIPSDIVRDLYEPLLARGGLIRGVFTRRPWHDLGTPRRYLEGVLDAAQSWREGRPSDIGAGPGVAMGGCWRHESAEVQDRASVCRSVLERGTAVERGAVVEGTLLMTGACVGAAARVRAAIVGPGVALDAESTTEGSLLTLSGPDGAMVSTPL